MSTELETITLTQTTPVEGPVREFVIPRQLGSVRLVEEVGRGGMGVVWLGRDNLLSRDVAVKFLTSAVAGTDDPGFKRFIEGARAAAKVRHAGLTAIHHADLVVDVPYLVMEYVHGPSLSQVRKTCGPLPVETVAALLEPVASAIGALHEGGIVHQDIKPGNVLLDADGRTYVTDFGLAQVRPPLGSEATPEQAAGTPAYMAPEMLDGHVSTRSDVYALGVVLFELLTGRIPFVGTLEQVRAAHRDQPVPRHELAERAVPRALIEVVERALHKEPVYRYKTARHLLRSFLEAVPEVPKGAAGERRLALLVARAQESGADDAGDDSNGSTPSSYYETLAARAAAKRSDTPATPPRTETSLDHVSESPREEPETVEMPETLSAFSVPCARCGYDLRGLSAEGRCPECGEAIERSLRAERLIFADPVWLERIRRGTRVMIAALLVLAGVGVVGVVAGLVAAIAQTEILGLSETALAVGDLAFGVLLFIGATMATNMRDRRYVRPEQVSGYWLRRVSGWGYILLLLAMVGWYALRMSNPQLAMREVLAHEVESTMGSLQMATIFGLAAGVWFFWVGLARRAPDVRLARRLNQAAIGFAAIAFAMLALATGLMQGLPEKWLVGMISGLMFGFLLVSGYLVLRFRGLLRRVLTAGRGVTEARSAS